MVGAALVPFVAVVVISFMPFSGPVLRTGFSFGNFTQLFERSYRPLTNTLMLATLAACGAMLIGVPIGYVVTRHRSRLSALIDIVATSPFAVAGTVLGIGLVMAFSSGFLILTGTWLIMVLAYMVRKLPFSVRSAERDPAPDRSEPGGGLDQSRRAAGAHLPAHHDTADARRHRGRLRAHLRDGRLGASSTVVLYSGPWTTMTVAMFQALEGTSAGVAAAAATVLIICTILPVALVYRLLRRHELSML